MNNKLLLFILAIVVISSCDRFERKGNVKGKESKEVVVNENGDSIMIYYRADGSIRSKVMFKNLLKDGLAYNYYDDGTIQFIINYKEGLKHGLATWNYESGKVYRETNYVDGLKDGVQKFYYETGELKAEVPFKMGKLQPGTKEYTKAGKLIKDYPKILVKPIDRLKEENKYYLQFSLDPPRKRVDFYLVKMVNGKEAKIELENYTKNGVARYPYRLYPGESIMERVVVRTKIKSKRGIPVILQRTYNLAAENRNW